MERRLFIGSGRHFDLTAKLPGAVRGIAVDRPPVETILFVRPQLELKALLWVAVNGGNRVSCILCAESQNEREKRGPVNRFTLK